MAKSILDIIITLKKAGGADKETIKGLAQLKTSITQAATMAGSLVAAGYAIKTAFDATVGTTVRLADEIRGIQQVSRLSAEESSKLVQIVDDFKISQEELLKVMQKNGDQYDYSVAGLAAMSDEYLALTDANQKANYMQERFGKSWGNFVELMEQGGEKIRAAGEGINEALIFDQASLDQAREYQKHLDELSDSWLALKVKIGNDVLPIVNQIFEGMERAAQGQKEYNRRLQETIKEYGNYGDRANNMRVLLLEERDRLRDVDSARWEGMASLYAAKDATESLTLSTEELAKAESDANMTLLGMIGSAQSVYESFEEKNKQLVEERMDLEAEKQKLLAQGYSEQSTQIQEINGKLDENKKKSKEVADQFEIDNKRIMLGYLERKLTADGTLTDAELKWLLEKGQAWGIYSKDAIAAMQAAMDQANDLIDTLNAIPDTINTTVTTTYTTTGSGTTTLPQPQALGGPQTAGIPYLVHQDEVIMPATDGFTLTRRDAMRALENALGGMQGGRSVNIYGNITIMAQGSVVDALEEIGS